MVPILYGTINEAFTIIHTTHNCYQDHKITVLLGDFSGIMGMKNSQICCHSSITLQHTFQEIGRKDLNSTHYVI